MELCDCILRLYSCHMIECLLRIILRNLFCTICNLSMCTLSSRGPDLISTRGKYLQDCFEKWIDRGKKSHRVGRWLDRRWRRGSYPGVGMFQNSSRSRTLLGQPSRDDFQFAKKHSPPMLLPHARNVMPSIASDMLQAYPTHCRTPITSRATKYTDSMAAKNPRNAKTCN